MHLPPALADLLTPEQYPPPRLSAPSLAWRWTVVGVYYLVIALATIGVLVDQPTGLGPIPPSWVLIADVVVGAASLVLVGFRRRFPFLAGLGTALAGLVSASSGGAALWAYVSLVSRRRWRPILLVAAVNLGVGVVRALTVATGPEAGLPWYLVLLFDLIGLVLVSVLGLIAGRRHDRQAADIAAVANAVRDRELAVLGERNRIAREMHDVLAHRISLVSMHAGVLAYRQDLTPEQTREIAGIIQDNAHASLSELRAVLSSLREAPEPGGVEAPQPSLTDLPTLLDEAAALGQRVSLDDQRAGDPLPPVISRHAYRIVAECLTNARKHAPAAPVTLSLAGGPGRGLTIRCTNQLAWSPSVVPGARLGLIGIGERVGLLGGTVEHHAVDGRFEVTVWLPWTP